MVNSSCKTKSIVFLKESIRMTSGVVGHSPCISSKVFEVLGNMLFALFAARTEKVDLFTIETDYSFTKFYLFILALL